MHFNVARSFWNTLIFPEEPVSVQLDFQHQSEMTDEFHGQDIHLVYLMNDAVESFLVFHNARMTGEYRPDYEGEISAIDEF